jgi:hypothetical protein
MPLGGCSGLLGSRFEPLPNQRWANAKAVQVCHPSVHEMPEPSDRAADDQVPPRIRPVLQTTTEIHLLDPMLAPKEYVRMRNGVSNRSEHFVHGRFESLAGISPLSRATREIVDV